MEILKLQDTDVIISIYLCYRIISFGFFFSSQKHLLNNRFVKATRQFKHLMSVPLFFTDNHTNRLLNATTVVLNLTKVSMNVLVLFQNRVLKTEINLL